MNRVIIRWILLLMFFKTPIISFAQKNACIINGFVKEIGSGETIQGANVIILGQTNHSTSNKYGFFSANVPETTKTDSIKIRVSMVGYQAKEVLLSSCPSTQILVELSITELEEVNIVASKQKISDRPGMGVITISSDVIKYLPAIGGEKDVIKTLQLFPGVKGTKEGGAGISVRGGGENQNLILLDEATVYNTNHLFGYFSVFNNDAVKNVQLIKGGFPAQYGGRLSSIVDVTMKEGNKSEIHGEGGVGLISSRLTLEGPIRKQKSSFIISGRRTYIDLLLSPILKLASENTATFGYFFYDLNAKLNFDLNSRNKLFLSSYLGTDEFNARLKFGANEALAKFNWQNTTATIRWNHIINKKSFSNLSLIFSDYEFKISADAKKKVGIESLEAGLQNSSFINNISLKYSIDRYADNHVYKIGIETIFNKFRPTSTKSYDELTNVSFNTSVSINSLQNALYFDDSWTISKNIFLNYGLRFSQYTDYNKAYYQGLEPRVIFKYSLSKSSAIKTSYSVMNQYIHLLSNTGSGYPTDLWVPTTDKIRPERSHQIAIGYYKDFESKGNISYSSEAYYKKMENIVAYKDGASFISILTGPSNSDTEWEKKITGGSGITYGIESLLQKNNGKFTGWIGHTLSWATWQFKELNNGQKFFPKNYSKHSISLVGIYNRNKKVSFSASWVFSTGTYYTIATQLYQSPTHYVNNYDNLNVSQSTLLFGDSKAYTYGSKNSFQAANYHRLDLAVRFTKKKRNYLRTWDLGLYNAYKRANPFYYQISDNNTNNQTQIKKVSIFPIIPNVTYNFKF